MSQILIYNRPKELQHVPINTLTYNDRPFTKGIRFQLLVTVQAPISWVHSITSNWLLVVSAHPPRVHRDAELSSLDQNLAKRCALPMRYQLKIYHTITWATRSPSAPLRLLLKHVIISIITNIYTCTLTYTTRDLQHKSDPWVCHSIQHIHNNSTRDPSEQVGNRREIIYTSSHNYSAGDKFIKCVPSGRNPTNVTHHS